MHSNGTAKQILYSEDLLTCSMLGKFSADDIFEICFLLFPQNRIRHVMQIVSNADNLHEMLNPVCWEK